MPSCEPGPAGEAEGLKVSVVTAVYNGAAHIAQCLDSVAAQTYPRVEHVVIDGGSTDGTVEILKAHAAGLAYWHSRRDAGIADAFNAGVRASTGHVLLFLGADDFLQGPDVVGQVMLTARSVPPPRFLYGDALYDAGRSCRRIARNFSWRRFRNYSCIPHQAMFLDRWFFDQYGLFDTSYRITMDYEHTARFIRSHRPTYVPVLVSTMRRTGVSTDMLAAHREMDRVRLTHGLAKPWQIRLFGWRVRLHHAAVSRIGASRPAPLRDAGQRGGRNA